VSGKKEGGKNEQYGYGFCAENYWESHLGELQGSRKMGTTSTLITLRHEGKNLKQTPHLVDKIWH
jgi:hypothetical protein